MSRRLGNFRTHLGFDASLAITFLALALLGAAVAADRSWFESHFLPSFSRSRGAQLGAVQGARLLAACAGLFLILFARPCAARAIANGRGRQLLAATLTYLLVVAAAFASTELVLRSRTWRSVQEAPHRQEPARRADAFLGWTVAPDHQGEIRIGGRTVHYVSDRNGYRVAVPGRQTDPGAPTILFVGESILYGYDLEWPDTIPAQVQAMLGMQAANAAVPAFGTDQIYLRLRQELPRFAQPRAIVLIFTPTVFDRNLDRDRPHLDRRLRWHAAEPPPLRLAELVRRLARYRSSGSIDEGVAMTRAVLRSAEVLARGRRAPLVIVVPEYVPEEPAERAVRRRVLDAGGIAYLPVPLDRAWRLPGDGHPDARGAHAIAATIAARLAHLIGEPRRCTLSGMRRAC